MVASMWLLRHKIIYYHMLYLEIPSLKKYYKLNHFTCFRTYGHAIAQAVTSISSQKSRFMPRTANIGFVVDKVELGQVFLEVLRFSYH